MQAKLKADLKRLVDTQVSQLTRQLNTYEKKLRGAVKDFEFKSREARDKSRTRLDQVTGQLRDARNELEKKVAQLNRGAGDLLNYLKSITKSEKMAKS